MSSGSDDALPRFRQVPTRIDPRVRLQITLEPLCLQVPWVVVTEMNAE
jgi:hypothetical protein